MTLFFSMLPLYLLGNLHCFGMCGPLVLFLSQHRYRFFYFLGRVLSFSLAGLIAGELGEVLNVLLHRIHLPAFTSFFFGAILLLLGIVSLVKIKIPLPEKWKRSGDKLSCLLLRDDPFAIFLFGFFTLMLPCGQTLLVFTACALQGDALTGLINGFAFAALTSPALFLAMHARNLFPWGKKYQDHLLGILALLIGILAILRGMADLELIPHLILHEKYHLVLF